MTVPLRFPPSRARGRPRAEAERRLLNDPAPERVRGGETPRPYAVHGRSAPSSAEEVPPLFAELSPKKKPKPEPPDPESAGNPAGPRPWKCRARRTPKRGMVWAPGYDPWGDHGGRLYSTALCALCIEPPCGKSTCLIMGRRHGFEGSMHGKENTNEDKGNGDRWTRRAAGCSPDELSGYTGPMIPCCTTRV